jgi:hypothetical protein
MQRLLWACNSRLNQNQRTAIDRYFLSIAKTNHIVRSKTGTRLGSLCHTRPYKIHMV